ncbi:MAG: hypothetical protein OXG39_00785 [Chloroflexi bacterium]|nr:hypothetical protein [Chloroflexota bacterium]
MSSGENQQRYDEIMRKIAGRRPFGDKTSAERRVSPHDRALDMVNAYDSFARLTQETYPNILCHGPKALHGKAWSGVVVWYHLKGYHGYQRLELFGVWAQHADKGLLLSVGIRKLSYRAPIFDAGVYRVAIENGFQLYYEDDGHPPGGEDQLLYQSTFDMKERLAHRQALSDILMEWRRKAGTA